MSDHVEGTPGDTAQAVEQGRIAPRTQIILIAVGIGLFNAILIGLLIYVLIVY